MTNNHASAKHNVLAAIRGRVRNILTAIRSRVRAIKGRVSSSRTLGWFKQPSNFISVAAIIAALAVPGIEKLLKSGEELTTKIDVLLTTTNGLLGRNQQRSGLGTPEMSILTAQRENDLERAKALADSIKNDVYPSVLFALSGELCASGEFEDAHRYIREVLDRGTGIHFLSRRPSAEVLAEAHVVSANCYMQEIMRSGALRPNVKKLAEDEMARAIAVLEKSEHSEQFQGQLAVNYAAWAKQDDYLHEPAQAATHRSKGREILGKMLNPDPDIAILLKSSDSVAPMPTPLLTAATVPRSPDGNTYIVNFSSDPNEAAVLIFPLDNQGHFYAHVATGTLCLYQRNLLEECYEVNTVNAISGKVTSIFFHEFIPVDAMSGKQAKLGLWWIVENADGTTITGTQNRIGRPPSPFIAKLSERPATVAIIQATAQPR